MRRIVLLAGLSMAAPGLAVPTPVTPFDLPLPGTTVAAEPELAGTVIGDKLVPFAIASATAPVSGTLQVRVVRNAAGKLAYYWKINNSASSKAGVDTFSVVGFPKQAYDANWRKDGLGTVAPSGVEGALSIADFKTWTYGFRFKTPVKPGESSRFFFLRSGATASVPGVGRVTGTAGGASGELPVSAPAS
ncbi:MAG TPA: hypothetical protein VF605_20705 [Allosphingosinicella sp.]|jgi:hypothetical protein